MDRSSPEMTRTLRDSYYHYRDVASNGIITKKQRADAWKKVQDAVAKKRTRPFCRARDGITTKKTTRKFSSKDWRFTKELAAMSKTENLDPIVLVPGFTSSVRNVVVVVDQHTLMYE